MKKIVFSSIRENAGKTSIIAGIISSMKKNKIKFAYAKPLGDRLIYKRKKSWDHDANVIVNILGRKDDLESRYEKITLGFDHSKLRYMYDEEGIKNALYEIIEEIGSSNDILILEGGRDLSYGTCLYLDPISVAKSVDAELIVVVSGDNDTILDDIRFIYKYLQIKDVNFKGVIINKVNDVDEFENSHLQYIKTMNMG
jgi:BioD-like phosphotransacetylase family protein